MSTNPPQWPPQAPPVVSTSLRCAQCGYDLTGATIGGFCSECGFSVAQSIRGASIGTKSNGTATACLVLGIVSIAACGLVGPVAIVLYYRAKSDFLAGGYSDSSRTMAKAGLIMGIIGTCIAVLYGLLFFLGVMLQ